MTTQLLAGGGVGEAEQKDERLQDRSHRSIMPPPRRRDKAASCPGATGHPMKLRSCRWFPIMTATPLNLRGLKCPLPALRVRKALKGAAPGTLFLVECTDPMAAIDIPNLMRETGDAIEESRSDGDLLVFHIRKASA